MVIEVTFIVCGLGTIGLSIPIDDGWVALLGVDARNDVYKGDKLVAETTEFDVSTLPDLESILTVKPSQATVKTKQTQDLLPVELTEDLLQRLLVPKVIYLSSIRSQRKSYNGKARGISAVYSRPVNRLCSTPNVP